MMHLGLVDYDLSRIRLAIVKQDVAMQKGLRHYIRLGLTTFVLTWASLDLVSIVCHDVIFAQILCEYFVQPG